MSVEITSTPVIVLSKTPYRESSLIVVGISPDYGRISLMCSGARKISGTSYVTVDLFRELSVEFTESRSTLKNAREIEILSTNDKLPEYPAHFRLAGVPDTTPAHTVGEDTLDILKEYGYSDEEIADMKAKKAVGMAGDPDVYNRKWRSKFG